MKVVLRRGLGDTARMFAVLSPGIQLEDAVDSIWDCTAFSSEHTRELRLPTGGVDIVINLSDEDLRYRATTETEWRTARLGVVSGPHSRSFVLDTARPLSLLGVQLTASRSHQLLPWSPLELHNLHASIEEVWGSKATELWEQLRGYNAAAGRLRHVRCWLERKISAAPEPHWALAPALEMLSEGDADVGLVCRRVGLSTRRLREVMRTGSGWTPKRFARLCRFRRLVDVLSSERSDTPPNLSRSALTCGYFDQAHMTREFREFAGVTPSIYLKHCTGHANHVGL